jgi:hypothetical protein
MPSHDSIATTPGRAMPLSPAITRLPRMLPAENDDAIRWAEPAPSLAALIGSADIASTWRRRLMSE